MCVGCRVLDQVMVTDPLLGSPSYRAMAARQRGRADQRRGGSTIRWSEPINLRAATEAAATDGMRLLVDGCDASQCDARLYWDHLDQGDTPQVIGRVEELRVAGRGWDRCIEAEVRLDLHTEQGRRQHARRQRGEPLAASIAFYPLEEPDTIGGWLHRWRLAHISLVDPGRQADPAAITQGWRL